MTRDLSNPRGTFLAFFSAAVFLVGNTAILAEPAGTGSRTLNIVVRDQGGALVTDLQAGDFSIVDNGAAQTVSGFKAPSGPGGEPRLVVLVFGGLSNQGRRYSRQAAEEFLDGLPERGTVTSVFVIDRRLYAQERFSTKKKDLEEAIELATSGSFERYRKKSEEILKDLSKDPQDALTVTDKIVFDALQQAGRMQREDGTYAALDSMTVLVEQLAKLPGRKAILFFSEGLVIQDVMFTRFNMLVSSAVASQTAIYTVDARGLLTSGVADGTRDMLGGAAEASSSQFGSTAATSAWQAQSLETAGQSVRMNVQEAIANLAAMTGASIVANTNDSRVGMKRIAEELNQYYQVSYAPDLKSDGTLRQVVVSVARPEARILSPKAYLDLPEIGGELIAGYELPLLQLLEGESLTNDFGVSLQTLHFGHGPEGRQHTLALTVPMQSFTFGVDEAAEQYHVNFSLVALVKDAGGSVVRKISQDYPLEGPQGKMDSMKAGNVLLLRNMYLRPGTYTLEGAARDNSNGAMSALRHTLEVPEWPKGPALSNVLVIDRVDPITDASKEQDNPLRYGDMKIAPNLGTPIVGDPQLQIGFYCVLYPSQATKEAPVLALLFFRDGQPLFKGQPPLPAPDEEGKYQVVLNLPMRNFQPGEYEVVAVVQQGEGVAEERSRFTIVSN